MGAWAPREWNEARLSELRRLWREPINQAEIAHRLGSCSDIIAEKAAGMGLPKRLLRNGPPEWTAQQVEILKRCWVEDKSCAVIAREIGGGITKNAVIGKARRLNLPKRQAPRYGAGKGRGRPLFRPKVALPRNRSLIRILFGPPLKVKPARQSPVTTGVAPMPLNLTLLQLTDRTCKYGVGEATGASQLFCGHRVRVGTHWCVSHYQLVYVPLVPRLSQKFERSAERAGAA